MTDPLPTPELGDAVVGVWGLGVGEVDDVHASRGLSPHAKTVEIDLIPQFARHSS